MVVRRFVFKYHSFMLLFLLRVRQIFEVEMRVGRVLRSGVGLMVV